MPSATPRQTAVHPGASGWQVSVLLVDDQPANLVVLKAILDGMGCNLVEARSGEEALLRARETEFAVILLDVLMPGLDGFQAATQIRSQERSRHTPIIFISAYESDQFPIVRAYSLGAVDYLVKPLVPEILRAKVASLVELYEQKQQIKQQGEQLRILIEGTTDYAIIMLDPTGQVMTWNPGVNRVMGYRAEEIIGQHFSVFYLEEDLRARKPARELEQALAAGKYEEEGWRLRKDGSRFWASTVITALRDGAGILRGFSKVTRDSTDRMRAEENARRLIEEQAARRALRENEERLRFALTAARMIAWDWDLATGLCVRSETATAILGLQTSAMEDFFRMVHPADRERVDAGVARAVRGEGAYELEFRVITPQGRTLWLVDRAEPKLGPTGQPTRLVGVCLDITGRKLAEQASRFLAQASATLATLVDFESTLRKVAGLAVPAFADWCIVHMKEPDGSLRRLAVTHADRDRGARSQEQEELLLSLLDTPALPLSTAGAGESVILPTLPDETLQAAAAGDEEQLRLVRGLGLKSYLSVPIRMREQELGVISFVAAESGRSYSAADLRLAEDLAHRAAIAIDNARLYSELKEAGRRKDEFLAMLAHELRNPLAPIRNALQIMKMPGANASTIEQARQMTERQVQHMVRLVDDLLDVSRIMRGKIELRKEPIALAVVVDHAVDTTRPILDAQGQEIIVALPDEPLRLEADPTRLAQVIGNLLHNAAKYSNRSGRVWLSAERQGEEIVLRVKDEGVGIRSDLLPHVFDLFVQGDRSLERSQGGLGIGLTVVRKLVEMHGGTTGVHSDGPGLGSEFMVRLPALQERHPSGDGICSLEGSPAAPRHQGRQILVVDDNVDAAKSMGLLLQLWGNQVHLAHTGPDALKVAATIEPELVILDIGLPGMNGYDVARQLRLQPRYARTVLAAVTGYGQDEDRRRSHDAGFNYHLTKPVDPDTLLRLVAGVLGRKS